MPIGSTPLQSLIESLVSDEKDAALALSDKRRSEFRKQFNEVDALNIKQPQLKLEVDQPPPAPPPVDPTAPPAPNPVPSPAGTPAAPAGADPTMPATGADPTMGGLPGTPGAPGDPMGAGGDPNDPTATGEAGDDPLGGGGGGGFGGFGGGGGGGGGADTDGESQDSGADGEVDGPEEPQGDPIKGMVDSAQELLDQTQDPSLILKSLKGQIQTLFSEPEHALGLVKALYDTNDSILQAVAMRLWLFLKAESPKR